LIKKRFLSFQFFLIKKLFETERIGVPQNEGRSPKEFLYSSIRVCVLNGTFIRGAENESAKYKLGIVSSSIGLSLKISL